MKIKEDFSLMSSLLIPVAVAINLTGFSVVKVLSIPLFLDSIGTVFISLLAGPWVGMATALITSLITGAFAPEFYAFIPVGLLIAVVMGNLGRFKMKNLVIKTIVCSICLACTTIISSAPIMVYVYSGVTPNATGGITTFILATGQNIWTSVFSSNLITETSDKVITVVIAMIIIKSMSERYLIKFKYGEKYINKN